MSLSRFRTETIGDATLILGDCREVLDFPQPFDAVVCDPPYGIGENHKKNASRNQGPGRLKGRARTDYGEFTWDDTPLDAETIAQIRAAGRWHVIFGGNYYDLPPASCWLVWDKLNGDSDFADCELAWTNIPGAVRRIRWLWSGCMKASGEQRGDHPTQKPLGVMRWVLGRLPAGTRTILDPVMGSGTTGVACALEGFAFTGIEREPKYFEAAVRRIEAAHKQPRLFDEPAPKPVQEALAFADSSAMPAAVKPLG